METYIHRTGFSPAATLHSLLATETHNYYHVETKQVHMSF